MQTVRIFSPVCAISLSLNITKSIELGLQLAFFLLQDSSKRSHLNQIHARIDKLQLRDLAAPSEYHMIHKKILI